MFGYYDINISFLSANTAWVIVAAIILSGLLLWNYYRTNPPVSLVMRIGLGLLRFIALVAIIAFLLEPVVSFKRDYSRKTRISVLTDNSASMQRSEMGVSRAARVDSLLAMSEYQRIIQGADVNSYFFATSLADEPNISQTDGTALGDVLHELRAREADKPSDLWLLLTDGNSNSGRSVEQALAGQETPVHVVGVFDDSAAFDVGLAGVDYNPIMFVGRTGQFTARLSWRGASGGSVLLQLVEDNRVVDEARFQISQETGFGEIALNYTPASPGQKLATVRVVGAGEEEDDNNNRRTFALKVLKSQLSVLLVSAAPDYELGFLNRYLSQSDKFDVNLVITGNQAGNLGSRFPNSQAELNRHDLLILHDPDPADFISTGPIIRSYLADKGGAVWVIMGERYAASRPAEWFDELLPFRREGILPIVYTSFQAEPDEAQLFHPAVRLGDDRDAIRRTWSNLPPFRMLLRCSDVDPAAVPLLYAGSGMAGENLPILGFKRTGPGKLVAQAAQPLWPIKFATLGFGEDDRYYHLFLDGLVSWLTAPDDFDPIRIAPDKEVFSRGEPVVFEAYAFDQGFRPIPAVTGDVVIRNDSSGVEYETEMIGVGEGRLLGRIHQVPPGKYSYRARLNRESRLLKESEGSLFVESFSIEEFDRSGSPSTLATIARMSGGRYSSANQFAELANSLDLSEVTEIVDGEFTIWGRYWLLLLFVLSLALEWSLRKLNHLV